MNQTTNVITPVAPATTTKTYKCDTCDAAYSDKMYFDLHKQSHQKDMPLVQIVMNPSGTHQVVPQPAPAHQSATQMVVQDDQLAAYKRAYGVEPQQVYTLAPVTGTQYQIISNNRSGTVSVPQSLQNQVNIPTYSAPTYIVATADGQQFHAISEVHHSEQQDQQQQQQTQQQHHQNQQHQVQNHHQQHQHHLTHHQHESNQQEPQVALTHQMQFPLASVNNNRGNRGIPVVLCQKDRPFKCDQCTASFIESGELDEHKKKHTGDGPFTCEDCHFTFMYKSHFKSHRTRCLKRRAMMPTPPKPIMNISPSKLQFPTNNVQNINTKQQHEILPHQQQSVQQQHNFQQMHNSHIGTVTKINGPSSNSKMNAPARQSSKQPLPSKFNPSNPSFKRIKKESRFDRPYECDECDASFQNEIDLKNHKSKHTGDGPFKCEECRFVFLYRKLYDAHRRRCEKKRKEKVLPGPIIISNSESLSVNANASQQSPAVGNIIVSPQTSQVQPHIQPQQQHQEAHVEGGQSIANAVPASLPSNIISNALQMHNVNVSGQPTIIEMRTNSHAQDVQQIQIPHHSILEQVMVTPGSGMTNISGGRHDIKYEIVPVQAGMIEGQEGVNVNQIMNLIKIKSPNHGNQ